MTPERVTGNIRRYLLMLTVLVLVGVAVELVLEEHYKEPLQLLPFGLCALGVAAALLVLLRPSSGSVTALRGIMVLLALGGAVGFGLHLAGNISFEQEVHPNITGLNSFVAALKGANPLLAPGTLGFAALLGLISTYGHPEAPGRGTS